MGRVGEEREREGGGGGRGEGDREGGREHKRMNE